MTGRRRAAPTRGSRVRRFLVETVLLLVIAVATAALVRAFVLQAFFVPSGSMEPVIERGDRILVSKLGEPERGDVVVFEDPGRWLPEGDRPQPRQGPAGRLLEFVGVLPPSDRSYLVKRLVGLPGDHVVCCDRAGRLRVNGVPVEEPYLGAGVEASTREFDIVVPKDAIWVLGDNRANSGDSRAHLRDGTAFVPGDNVVGQAVVMIWPLSDAHRLGAPDAFAAVPKPDRPAPAEPVVSDDARDPGLDG